MDNIGEKPIFAVKMKRIVYLVMVIGVLLGCGERREYREMLSRAEEMMNSHPDSALMILDSLGQHEKEFGRHFRMQYLLHRTNAYNKLDTLFHSTNEIQSLADYFEDNGTANEQMLAYYLLGRAYFDIHEAPLALKYYQMASEKADTTDNNCNFRQLSRIYGQMSRIFYQQNLMDLDLKFTDLETKYAWIAKDTLNALLSMTEKIYIYQKKNQVDSAIIMCTKLTELFESYGQKQISSCLPIIILRDLINRKEISKAKAYMDRYETESGFFNSNNEIETGREIYYYSKGQYYLATHQYDSAEYLFRKELKDGKDFNNQNAGARGLAKLFQLKHLGDSAVKYALYSYEMNDSVYAQMAIKEVEQIHGLYDYTRNQEIAQQEMERAEREEEKAQTILIFFFLFVIVTAGFANIIHKKRKVERRKYEESISALAKTQSDILLLRSDAAKYENKIKQLIEDKETEAARLNSDIEEYKKKIGSQKDSAETQLQKSKIYSDLRKTAGKGIMITEEEWHHIYVMTIEIFPSFYQFISSKKYELNDKEFNTSILIRLHFTPKEIANMLGVSSPYITKIRNQMMKKLFGVEGTSKELDEKLMDYS